MSQQSLPSGCQQDYCKSRNFSRRSMKMIARKNFSVWEWSRSTSPLKNQHLSCTVTNIPAVIRGFLLIMKWQPPKVFMMRQLRQETYLDLSLAISWKSLYSLNISPHQCFHSNSTPLTAILFLYCDSFYIGLSIKELSVPAFYQPIRVSRAASNIQSMESRSSVSSVAICSCPLFPPCLVVMVTDWRFRIEKSRAVLPKMISLLRLGEKRHAKVNWHYFYHLLFTRRNIKLVHIACHIKQEHHEALLDDSEIFKWRLIISITVNTIVILSSVLLLFLLFMVW